MTLITYIPILILSYYLYKHIKLYKQLEAYCDYLEEKIIQERKDHLDQKR